MKCDPTNLRRDAINHVPIEHEPLLPPELNRHLLLPLPPARGQSGARNAGRRASVEAAPERVRGGGTTNAKATRRPRVVRGRGSDDSRRAAQYCCGADAGVRLAKAQCRRRGGCAIAEQADIERGLRERVLLCELRDLLHANVWEGGGGDELVPL